MQLSVIIPVYNAGRFIRRCVSSILSQGVENMEILLVDDGSTDDSYQVCNSLAEKDTRVKVLHKENGGAASARNLGLRNAMGEWVAFVDSDDYLAESTLKCILSDAVQNDVDILIFGMKILDSTGNCINLCDSGFRNDKVYSGEEIILAGKSFDSVCNKLYRRTFIAHNTLWFIEGMVHEDSDFNARAYVYAKRVMFVDTVGYIYAWTDNSVDRSADEQSLLRGFTSNLKVAANMMAFIQHTNAGEALIEYYRKHSNSMVMSDLLQIFLNRNLSESVRSKYICIAKEEGLYPIEGYTKSWKTTLLLPLVNTECLFERMCAVVRKLYSLKKG